MARLPSHPALDGFRFQPPPPARHEQLFRFLHDAIASGLLRAGSRLPPTRHVAAQLGISRQTVVVAYERLLAEGMIDGRPGAGSFVSPIAQPIADRAKPTNTANRFSPSQRSALLHNLLPRTERSTVPPLQPGIPDLSDFPYQAIAKLATRYWRTSSPAQLSYGDGAGVLELREAVSDFLRTFRGVPCSADQIVITNGTQSSIVTAAHVAADVGETALTENPGYSMVHSALLLSGLKLRPVAVDLEGVDLESQSGAGHTEKMLVCTPSHHYPLGITTPLHRRLELLEWADRVDGLIIEDDYDSEFRYSGAPLPSLTALDQGRGRVIYAGTFSKLLAPGLRIGFLVVPDHLIDAFRAVRATLDRHPSAPIQHICADFIFGGHLAAHIRKMKPIYAERREALINGLRGGLDGHIELIGTEAGLHACALMKDERTERVASDVAKSLSLGCIKLSSFTVPGADALYWGLAFGFATTDARTTYTLASRFAKSMASRLR